ncbi:MAG: sulfite exporter TauE/SafE family protein, partial [Elusimicrobiota bacterium]|nr:sulfite exporter TauE/SafE family protein [Elusimicrobiota bacterium]
MKPNIKTQVLYIANMTCLNCEKKLEEGLKKLDGVLNINASFAKGEIKIVYDADKISLDKFYKVISDLGYEVSTDQSSKSKKLKVLFFVLGIIVMYSLVDHLGLLNFLLPPNLPAGDISFLALFFIGLVTGMHCIAMCGGINISQSIGKKADSSAQSFKPALLYNLGRLISYTAIGFIVGALGTVFAFSLAMQGWLKIFAAILMIIVGANMFGLLAPLQKFIPRLPKKISNKLTNKFSNSGPFIVGLLNGFMPCGPLQTMQFYALSTGGAFLGAMSMFAFGAGTVVLMFALGVLSAKLAKKWTNIIFSIGAIMIVIFGLAMLRQGFELSSQGVESFQESQMMSPIQTQEIVEDEEIEVEQEFPKTQSLQIVRSVLAPRSYPNITVVAGKPVRWIIDAPAGSINGCNNKMYIAEYRIEHIFKTGQNV